MANIDQITILKQGVEVWNLWYDAHRDVIPDFIEYDLRGMDLSNAKLDRAEFNRSNLHGVNFAGADLTLACFNDADVSASDLRKADLWRAFLRRTNFREADLRGADLSGADLHGADLSGANLCGANLTQATLVATMLENAVLSDCRIYGTSVWDAKGKLRAQDGLVITPPEQPTITVDDLEVGQFIYLLLNREKLRNVLTTITSKAVLLLGCFTPERKAILDALADRLRKNNLLPIIFDFERSTNRDFTETIKILAGLSMFVIVDLTKPKSAPQELTAIIPDYQIPFVPILEEGEDPYSMFMDFKKYNWVLTPILKYRTKEVLMAHFKEAILDRAWKKRLEIQRKRNEELEVMSIEEMIDRREAGAH
jgi:hypothetical protein